MLFYTTVVYLKFQRKKNKNLCNDNNSKIDQNPIEFESKQND